jgi:hypothetical protein
MRARIHATGRAAVMVLVSVAASPTLADAQAMTPPKGEGSVSLVTSTFLVTDHVGGQGERIKVGDIRSNSMLMDVTYGVTDRIALTFSLPWVASKYTGPRPHPGSIADTGGYYETFQDLNFTFRYNLKRGPAWITPFVAAGVPSHDYAYYGHAAAGRRMKELQVGVSVAKLLDPWIPRTFVQGRYAFGLTEEVMGYRPNRSYLDVEGGYFVTPSFRAFGLMTSHFAHGGVTLPPAGPPALGPVLFPYHDQISAEEMLNLGGGVGFAPSDSLDVFSTLVTTTWGKNGHAINYGFNLGLTWTFKKGVEAAAASRHTHSLVKCACQKHVQF